MPDQPPALRAWHAVVAAQDPALLGSLLADDVVFRSPAVFAPQHGKAVTTAYLTGAMAVLGPTLRYVAQWHDDSSAVLEFEAELDGGGAGQGARSGGTPRYTHGVDMLRWNTAGLLTSITVMVRPLRGLETLIELMARELAAGSGG